MNLGAQRTRESGSVVYECKAIVKSAKETIKHGTNIDNEAQVLYSQKIPVSKDSVFHNHYYCFFVNVVPHLSFNHL